MANNVSGYGFIMSLAASYTFPSGFVITQFADDADPVTSEPVNIGDATMGLNGDLITWQKAEPLKLSISVITGSDDDVNLSIIADNNRVGKGKFPVQDEITLTKIFPDGSIEVYSNGIMVSAPVGTGVGSSGRLKTKTYGFVFENRF